jgi:hypothetical protein
MVSGSEIDQRREVLLRQDELPVEQIEREYRQAKANEVATKQAKEEWFERNGLNGPRELPERCSKIEDRAKQLLEHVPGKKKPVFRKGHAATKRSRVFPNST